MREYKFFIKRGKGKRSQLVCTAHTKRVVDRILSALGRDLIGDGKTVWNSSTPNTLFKGKQSKRNPFAKDPHFKVWYEEAE